MSLHFGVFEISSLKIVLSYYGVHLLREQNPLGLVIKAFNGTTYLKDRNIRGNKIITSAQEEGTRPELELVGINVAGEAGAAGGHSTLGT